MGQVRAYTKPLCAKAPYSDKTMSGGVKEDIENAVRMPEDEPEALIYSWSGTFWAICIP